MAARDKGLCGGQVKAKCVWQPSISGKLVGLELKSWDLVFQVLGNKESFQTRKQCGMWNNDQCGMAYNEITLLQTEEK